LSDRRLRVGASLVAIAGLAVAGYLIWAHYAEASVFCGLGGGCETVQSSSYATIAEVPVAALGLGAYGTLLVLLVRDGPVARLAAAAIALAGLLFSMYLLVVQLFVIDAVCVWCLANDVVIAPALAVLTALRLRS
jgi:uncharacterized membrane protein